MMLRLKVGDLFALAKRITGEQPTTQAFENFVSKITSPSTQIVLPMACGGVLPSNIW